jgi:hypothetical protein
MFRSGRAAASTVRSIALACPVTFIGPSKHRMASAMNVQRSFERPLQVTRARAALVRASASGRPWTCSAMARDCFESPVHLQRSSETSFRVARTRAAAVREGGVVPRGRAGKAA